MKRPMFTCVMPVKGERPFMAEAMKSLSAQGMADELEVIVQDADVETDEGQSDALNKGFSKARGEWLFWLNADDVLLPGALKAVAECVAAQGVEWVAGNVVYLDETSRVRRCAYERGAQWLYQHLPVRVGGPSSFFSRALLERCGGFDTSLHYCMDTDMWCRFRAAGAWYVKLPRYLWGFRIHEGSKTAGALQGAEPSAMKREHAIIDERYGVTHWRSRVALLRAVRMLDGSSWAAARDTWRARGKRYEDCAFLCRA